MAVQSIILTKPLIEDCFLVHTLITLKNTSIFGWKIMDFCTEAQKKIPAYKQDS